MILHNSETNLTYPVIIMRTGGLDGVALQAREYRRLLNKLDINVHVITGRCETKFATTNPIGHKQTIISRLDFHNKHSKLLFANQFVSGSETDDVAIISDEEWLRLFEGHKEKIKSRIDGILQSIKYNTPVLIYNLISLRHAHPAAAVALRELIEKYPQRAFISHSADPDAERPEKINRIKKHLLPLISAFGPDQEYSGGPFNMDNLYHIVLNPTQRENFISKYNIPGDHVFEIPDFLEFASREPIIRKYPKKIFMDFMADRRLKTTQKSYRYCTGEVDKDTVFFLSPVRPVYRKRLKEAMLAAMEYGKAKQCDVAFVVTHPNIDDKSYFLDSLKFAELIGLPYYHLGEAFTLETLDSVYENLSACKSIGVIASSAGGWENALNEMARECIPFFMDYNLNSYKPLTEEIGIRTHGVDFGALSDAVKEIETSGEYKPSQYFDHPFMRRYFDWTDSMLDPDARYDLVEHNYRKAYDYLSHEATMPKLVSSINYIYARHGSPRDHGAE
jgi:hypothetical protein